MKETILNPSEHVEEQIETVEQNSFDGLGLAPEVLKAIQDMGFEEPSQIQAAIIPTLMSGSDAIGQAQTGTGKTLAFGAPMISILRKSKRKVSGLVLAPTRELAVQVSDELTRLSSKTNLRILPVFGGAPIDRQMRALKEGVDIVVGTPGRVIDLINRKKLMVEDIEFFVLDEADEMLNMGFIEDVEEILSHASDNRQTMLFSATMPPAIKNLTKRFLKPDAEHITIKKVSLTVDTVEQYYFEIKHKDRFESLCRILDATSHSTVLIFCNTKRNVDTLTDHLKSRGYDVEGMHGDINQAQRMRTLAKFKEGTIEFLVATDVAARGIDVENISHVINYDLPQDLEAYVHRIGRTGRAGRTGTAFSLVTPREYMDIKQIEKMTHSKIRRKEIPTVEDIFETKYADILTDVREELEKEDYKRFLPHVTALDEDYNLAEVAAALMMMRYRDEVSFDYTQNKLEQAQRNARVFITVGKMDGLNPLKLLKFLQSNTKVDSRDIGDIEILEKFSFFEIKEDLAAPVIEACSGKKLLGRKAAMDIAEGSGKRKSRSSRPQSDKPHPFKRKKVY
ncbi:DEAD-box ATP-dependent RNA helicase CshA [anaerobic digester metagenome]